MLRTTLALDSRSPRTPPREAAFTRRPITRRLFRLCPGKMRTSPVDEHAAHDFRGYSEELRAILPDGALLIDEP